MVPLMVAHFLQLQLRPSAKREQMKFFFFYDVLTINLREVAQNNLLQQHTASSAAFSPPG